MYKLTVKRRAGKHKLRAEAGKYKLRTRVVKYKLAAGAVKYKFGLGAKAGAGVEKHKYFLIQLLFFKVKDGFFMLK